jgi:hypothetical protein
LAGEPVETGIVASLSNPGGNISGVSLMASASHGKSVDLFRDMLPSVKRVGALGHSANPVFAKAMLDEVRLAGGPTGTEIQPVVMVRGPDELDSAFSTFVTERVDAIVVQGSLSIKAVTDLAINHRIPALSTARAFAEIGGLLSFGADGPASVRHAARFVLLPGEVDRFGFASGVGVSSRADPRTNLGYDPYVTDGLRVVIFLGAQRSPMNQVEFIDWERPPPSATLGDLLAEEKSR